MGDMKLIGRLILVALVATLIGGFFISSARGAVSAYTLVSVGQLGTDSSETHPVSVYFYWCSDGLGLVYDSAAGSPMNTDSLVWFYVLTPGTGNFLELTVPAVWAQWNWTASIDRDNSLGIVPWAVNYVDSLDQIVSVDTAKIGRSVWDADIVAVGNRATGSVTSVTANVAGNVLGTVDSVLKNVSGSFSIDTGDASLIADTVDARLTAAHGSGSWASAAAGTGAYVDSVWVAKSTDTTAIGSGVAVWLRPNGGGTTLKALSDANSWATFAVDADTYLVSMWVVGYTQTVVPDTNAVAAADTRDTVYLTPTTPASPPAPGLTPVTFTFYDGTGDSLKNVVVQYKLDATGQVFHYDSTKIIDPSLTHEARSNASGVVTINVIPNDSLYTTGYQTGKTKWQIRAFNGDNGATLLGNDGIKITVTASATALRWPQDF